MRFDSQPLPAEFIRRDNRFRAVVRWNGGEARAHLPNPGRLQELLIPGNRCWVRRAVTPGRATPLDLCLVVDPVTGALVSLDTRLPNRLFAEALRARQLPEFVGYGIGRQEVTLPGTASDHLSPSARAQSSRIDFLLSAGERRCWVETKSCTLVEDGLALFPDAPTTRGARHLHHLINVLDDVTRAAVVFIIQRADPVAFAPHAAADPVFARALQEAAASGVAVHAYACSVALEGIILSRLVPVCV